MKPVKFVKKVVSKPGWLTERFGKCYSQISVSTTLRLRSSIKDVFRALHGQVPSKIEEFCKELPVPPQGITDKDFIFGYEGNGEWVPGLLETNKELRTFTEQYPKEWAAVQRVVSLSRQRGRHASAYLISNEPVENFIPLTTVGGVQVTQYDASGVEAVGGLKMDFLVVNSIRDIDECLKIVQSSYAPELGKVRRKLLPEEAVPAMDIGGKRVPLIRCVPLNGQFYDIWDLPDDQNVFYDICRGDTATVFQLDTAGAVKWLREFNKTKFKDELGVVHKLIDTKEDIFSFIALDRPGPLDAFVKGPNGEHNMLVEYASRAQGKPKNGNMEILDHMLPETYGLMIFQEQTAKVFRTVGKTTAIEAENFRSHTSKKQIAKVLKDKEIFMKGAVETVGQDQAEKLWEQLLAWSNYGFCKAHSVAYGTTSYACAWLKHHYPVEWWCAVLRNADRNEINEKFWRHCGHLIDVPDIQKSGPNFEVQNKRIRAPLWLMNGIGEKAQKQINQYAPYTSIEDFCQKIEKHKLLGVKKVKKTKKDKKTNTEMEVEKDVKGRSSISDTAIYALIISGAMDGLFPPGLDESEKLSGYEKAKWEATTGKKKAAPNPIKPDLHLITPIQKYQFIKRILPSLYRPFEHHVCVEIKKDLRIENDTLKYIYNKNAYCIANRKQVEGLLDFELLPKSGASFACICYVVEDRRFEFSRDEQTKRGASLMLEVGGYRLQLTQWAGQSGLLPEAYLKQGSLTGSVGVAIVLMSQKLTGEIASRLVDFIVVSPPITQKEE